MTKASWASWRQKQRSLTLQTPSRKPQRWRQNQIQGAIFTPHLSSSAAQNAAGLMPAFIKSAPQAAPYFGLTLRWKTELHLPGSRPEVSHPRLPRLHTAPLYST